MEIKTKQYKKGSGTQLSKNFNLKEWDCKCNFSDCTWTLVSVEHLRKLQDLRDKIKKSITINSAYRCNKYNKLIGGSTNSRHTYGDATDVVVKDIHPDKLALMCEHFDGLGRYDTFTHIDSRGHKARWDFRGK